MSSAAGGITNPALIKVPPPSPCPTRTACRGCLLLLYTFVRVGLQKASTHQVSSLWVLLVAVPRSTTATRKETAVSFCRACKIPVAEGPAPIKMKSYMSSSSSSSFVWAVCMGDDSDCSKCRLNDGFCFASRSTTLPVYWACAKIVPLALVGRLLSFGDFDLSTVVRKINGYSMISQWNLPFRPNYHLQRNHCMYTNVVRRCTQVDLKFEEWTSVSSRRATSQ